MSKLPKADSVSRRDFVWQGAIATIGLGLGINSIVDWYKRKSPAGGACAKISEELAADFNNLRAWLRSSGWASYVQQKLAVNLDLEGKDLERELTKELDATKLRQLRRENNSGFDDFAGNKLVEPGFPNYSLLFHLLASPRVRPATIKEYPGLHQIDALENYIYGVCSWEQLKSMHGITSADKLVLAVFAYEYRPAFKTPHQVHADLVYSRTGIARIGTEPHNYDKVNRCHTAKPADALKVKTAAIMPARYGAFIARVANCDDISLVTAASYKGKDEKDDRNDDTKAFLQPIRKIFDYDDLFNNANLQFREEHVSEKLNKLAEKPGIEIWKGRKPQKRHSKTLIVQDVNLRKIGSSFLVLSQPAPLIRPAKDVDGKQLFVKVPPKTDINRYFTAFATQEVENVELLDSTVNRVYNLYPAPRNQPLFVNITNIQIDTTDLYDTIRKDKGRVFENFVDNGKYFAPLFEDSICDGNVCLANKDLVLEGRQLSCLPAFSIVTAPDFFPQVDPLDLMAYDVAPGSSAESNFYEGGVASLATARIRPNPKIINSKNEETKDTYLAVLSQLVNSKTGVPVQQARIYGDPSVERDYEISSFLPDVASSVFAPGWDVTYCSLEQGGEIYIGTEGLGSPFVEDMKFCAALNGMWPATSPDAARTYQGSNEFDFRNPTAIPLLDDELGICGDGPAGSAHNNTGWDGEQGPYLEWVKNSWKINFTDMGRADAIANTLNNKIDLSRLRKLKSPELIARMECLKKCIHSLPKRNFRDSFESDEVGFTYLWLVSAEKVNWGNEDAQALGIPRNLVGSDKTWITSKANAKVRGPGYLYVFVNSEEDDPEHPDWANTKRRRLGCVDIYVCQVTNNRSSPAKIAWAEIKKGIKKVNWTIR